MTWFKIDRQIFDHWLWQEKPFSKGQAWIDLLGLASYLDSKTPYRGKIVDCKRGTVHRSISYLAARWGWSRDKTRNFLSLLEADGMVQVKATKNRTTITLVNYGKFQDLPATDSSTDSSTGKATNRQRAGNEPATSRQRDKKVKNIKEGKEGKKIKTSSAGIPLPPEYQRMTDEELDDEVASGVSLRDFIMLPKEEQDRLYKEDGWE